MEDREAVKSNKTFEKRLKDKGERTFKEKMAENLPSLMMTNSRT